MTTETTRTGKSRQALLSVFILTLTYLVVQIIGGIVTNSLALLADSAHMLTDVGGLGLSLFAVWISQRPASPSRTYGYYRVEILAALLNAVALLGSAVFILVEAYHRFQQPPEVTSGLMFVIAVIGLVINLIGIRILHSHGQESLNLQGALLEVISDALGSLGVILAAAIMWFTGWYYADPIASVLVSLFIFPRTWGLLRQAVDILLESTPAHISIPAVRQRIEAIKGVASVHDLHVWTITTGMDALSAHVVLNAETGAPEAQQVLEAIRQLLKEEFGINHTTVQLEHRSLQENEPVL